MSKIFDAYQMRVAESSDPVAPVPDASGITLYSRPKGAQQAEFSQLSQRILGLKPDHRAGVFSVASCESGEGASFVSYNLAVSLAQTYGQRVAWVDANFLSPQKVLTAPTSLSFSSLLQNPELAEKVTVGSNPALISGGSNLNTSRGLLASQNYGAVLTALAAQFDFVFLDLPPILDSTETGLMAAGGDGLLLVIEHKYLKWEIVEHGIQILKDKDVNVLGSVINRREYTLPRVIYDRF